jgi:peptidoglycan/LPS O-acetylase OafA/YrhL
LFRSGDFFLGCIFGLICIQKDVSNEKNSRLSPGISLMEILWVIACVILCIYRDKNLISVWLMYGIVWIPTSICGVYLFYKEKGLVTRLLSNKLLITIGNISAYGFLIHQMTIHIIKFIISDIYYLSLVSLIATIIFCLIYEKFENGLMRLWNKMVCREK